MQSTSIAWLIIKWAYRVENNSADEERWRVHVQKFRRKKVVADPHQQVAFMEAVPFLHIVEEGKRRLAEVPGKKHNIVWADEPTIGRNQKERGWLLTFYTHHDIQCSQSEALNG